MPTPIDHAAVLARAARAIGHEHTLEQTLDAIATAARDSVPGIDHAGISIINRKGEIETMAATDPLVWELDRLQYAEGQGPCLSAMGDSPVVAVPDAHHDQRWPAYLPRALELGLRSQLAVRLFLDDEGTMGGLNLYSTTQSALDPDAVTIADLFGAHAAIALHRARQVDDLNHALASRKVIGQAIGIVMERYTLDEDQAFAFLLRASSHGNIKLRDLATELVAQANHRTTDRPSQ